MVGLHDALLPVGLGAARDARRRRAHGRLAADRLGRHRHARAARARRAPRRTTTTRAAARSRSPPPASARSRSSSRASTPRSRWPATASTPRSGRSSRALLRTLVTTHREGTPEMAVDVTAAPTGARTGSAVPRRPARRRPRGLDRTASGSTTSSATRCSAARRAVSPAGSTGATSTPTSCLYDVARRPASPSTSRFLQPRSREADLERRRIGDAAMAEYHGGVMGRAPDYLNVTFALFAARADVWARRGNERGAENLVRYYELMREHDLSTTHAIMNPQVDRSRPDAAAGAGEIALHKVGETAEGIVVRGARMLATLAPYADEISIYPGSPLRPAGHRLRALLRAPDEHARASRWSCATRSRRPIARASTTRSRRASTSRTAIVIFDDVVVPWDRVFMDGDTIGYDEVIIAHQLARADRQPGDDARLDEARARRSASAHAITDAHRRQHASTTCRRSSARSGRYVEMTRSGVIASEAGCLRRRAGQRRLDARRAPARRAARAHAEVDPARLRADSAWSAAPASW